MRTSWRVVNLAQINGLALLAAILLAGCSHIPPASRDAQRRSRVQLSGEDQKQVEQLLGVTDKEIQSIEQEAPDILRVYCYGSKGMDWAGPLFRLHRKEAGWSVLGRGTWDGAEKIPSSSGFAHESNSPLPMEIPRPKF